MFTKHYQNQLKPSLLMRKSIFLLVCSLLAFSFIHAQNRTIHGTITDDKGAPLSGATVNAMSPGRNVIGTTITDERGYFSFSVSNDVRYLQISYVGYQERIVPITNENEVAVQLSAARTDLSEVVVVGYGLQRRREIASNIATVQGEKVANKPVQSFEAALGGRATGVQITIPNGVVNNPPVFRIRGTNSISLSSYPLIVIDGVPTFTGDVGGTNAAANALASINPNDIESIDIAKDAAGAAIYGSRAANGVVFITTKKGAAGRTRVTYDGWVGFTKVYGLPDLLNAAQYVEIKNEGLQNAGTYNPTSKYYTLTNGPDGKPIDTKWYDYIYRTALAHNNSVSVSGASNVVRYYLSVNYTDQEGIIRRNQFKRKSILFNADARPSKMIMLGAKISYSNEENLAATTSGSLPGEGFNTGGLGRLAIVNSPAVSPYLSDGSYNIQSNNTLGVMDNKVAQVGFFNPVPILDLNYSNTENNHTQTNIYLQLKPLDWLTLRTNYGLDYLLINNNLFWSPVHGDGFSYNGYASSGNTTLKRWVWTNTLQADYVFAQKHSISFLAGEEEQRTTQVGFGINRQNLTDPFFTNIQGGYTINNPSGMSNTENYLFSLFGRLNYVFNGKYIVGVNARRDEYSAFGFDNKAGNFYGVSAAWDIAKENFWTSGGLNKVVNSFKLRGSYGKVGNVGGLADFGALSLYGGTLFGGSSALIFTQAGNPLLKWESSKKTDVGFTFGLFNDAVTGEFTYYNNNNEDLIYNVPYAPSVGLPNNITQNVASMYNRGVEINVSATPIKKDFRWNTSLNITTNKNEVTALAPEAGITQFTTSTSNLETVNITKVGLPVGTLFVTRTDGVDPATGRRIFINANGEQVYFQLVPPAGQFRYSYADGSLAPNVSSADAQPYKNTNPKIFGGWDNTVSYKNFELNMLWTFQLDYYIYYGTNAGLRDQRFWNNSTDVLRRWQKPNDVTDIPRVVDGDNISNGSSFPLDINVFKGDFFKLRTLTLGYYFPKKLLDKAKIASARVYVSAQNLAIITDYPGPDPEVSSNGNGNTNQGVERNSVANGRTFTFGVNVSF